MTKKKLKIKIRTKNKDKKTETPEKRKTIEEIVGEEYDNSYIVNVCPYCNHSNIVKIYTGSDGLFSSKSFLHYKCSKCSREFDSRKWLRTVSKEAVQRIVQLGLNNEINKGELKAAFGKIGVWVH